jgi:hypothetical protein
MNIFLKQFNEQSLILVICKIDLITYVVMLMEDNEVDVAEVVEEAVVAVVEEEVLLVAVVVDEDEISS